MVDTIDPSQILAKPDEEQLCQLIASGSNQTAAFAAVYGRHDTASACRKARRTHIQARVNWLRVQAGEQVIERLVTETVAVTVETVKQTALTRQWVLDSLIRNAKVALGDELVTVKKIGKDDEGNPKVIENKITMRDASATNRALEILGRELGLWEGTGAADDARDRTEKAPIKVGSNERAVAFLERHFSGRTPAAIIGRKFKQAVGNA